MLIAEAAAGCAAHPASQTSDCEKHRGLLDTPDPMSAAATAKTQKRKKKNLGFCSIYRSWVPDEDLGAAVGELVCRDLHVIHQNLHALPAVSQRSQGSRRAYFMTFHTNIQRHGDLRFHKNVTEFFRRRTEEDRVRMERLGTKRLL